MSNVGGLLGEFARQCVDGRCVDGRGRWQLDLGTGVAEICLAPDGTLCFRAEAAAPPDCLAALQASSLLPGNVRHARDPLRRLIVADTQVNGARHLPQTLQVVRTGICQALGMNPGMPMGVDRAIERGELERALGQLSWSAEGVVEREDGWELRPRLRGDAVPVRVTLEPTVVSLTRHVLTLSARNAKAVQAIADQAVRCNDQLRHARLVVRADAVIAETRLHRELIDTPWLDQAARAVAHAARLAATRLDILAAEPRVVELYIAAFCSDVELPAWTGAGELAR
jgi:hypothetical protein